MPEIPCDLKNLASRLNDKISARRPYRLVVVAEGAKFVGEDSINQRINPRENPRKMSQAGQVLSMFHTGCKN